MKPEEAEKAWQACRAGVEQSAGGEDISDRRIYWLRWMREGKDYEATVGEEDPYDGFTVMAIVATESRYWVCNLKRGFSKVPAPMIGLSQVRDFKDFDPGSYP